MVFISRLVSSLFHPIFILNYVLVLLYFVNPYLFGLQDNRQKGLVFFSIFMLSVFFPLFTILILKVLGIVKSYDMKDRQERVIPLLVTSIFYLWLYVNIKQNSIVPTAFTIFVLGSTISIFMAFFINNFSKISLHAVGMGGLVIVVLLIRNYFSYDVFHLNFGALGKYSINMDLILIVAIIFAGLVGSARLFLHAHKPSDVYGGYLVGILAQCLAFIILK